MKISESIKMGMKVLTGEKLRKMNAGLGIVEKCYKKAVNAFN